jgi:hypothetical protein
MATIVNPDDFVGEINIANTDETAVIARVNWFIAKYEAKFLEEYLGEELSTAFLEGLAADPIEEKWATLRDKLKPAIADYIYYFYSNDSITYTSGQGDKKPQSENATNASSWSKMVRAWNEMVKYNFKNAKFIRLHPDDYPDFKNEGCDYFAFYINGWFYYDRFYECYGYEAHELYRFKNSLGL